MFFLKRETQRPQTMSAFFLFISCVLGVAYQPDQYLALVDFFNQTNARSFNVDPSMCPDAIVPPNVRTACNVKGQITSLYLGRASLMSKIGSSLSLLTDLVYLNLSDNLLVGNLSALSSLTNLQTLDVSYNALSDDALSLVAQLPFLKNCVLQALPPKDTNCFQGSVDVQAPICNNDKLNPLNLCKTFVPRPTTTSTIATTRVPTTSTTPTTNAAPKTTQSTSPVYESESATTSNSESVVLTTSQTQTTTKNLWIPASTTSSSEVVSLDQAPPINTVDTESWKIAVVFMGVAIFIMYCLALTYVLMARYRKKKRDLARTMGGVVFPSANDVLDVSTVSEHSSRPDSAFEYAKISDAQLRKSSSTGNYDALPVTAKQVPAAVSDGEMRRQKSRSLKNRGASLKRPPPLQREYSQLPPPIIELNLSGSSSASVPDEYSQVVQRHVANYDKVSAITVYDKCESSLD
jgi:hypothetical protein